MFGSTCWIEEFKIDLIRSWLFFGHLSQSLVWFIWQPVRDLIYIYSSMLLWSKYSDPHPEDRWSRVSNTFSIFVGIDLLSDDRGGVFGRSPGPIWVASRHRGSPKAPQRPITGGPTRGLSGRAGRAGRRAFHQWREDSWKINPDQPTNS